ncbi:NAD-dependent deacetylase sirtuin-2 [Myriangium duriaei CBS 260.36]|uniref:NAD-dependent protein deacetylase n=1 Tax=Myriangium duriaei CBS 260.36 TaxID=1168546 RepID=A0A9P4JE58_9PEZI|nr:NAD-dependent deacetylase sirtuin-2 [Myriangium duriaei CBS 260.36]
MGQEGSTPVDENVPPLTLSSRTLDGVASLIKSGRAKRIVIMAGAGISTSAGIPDFRSPDTGLYANLARLELPFAEAVFDISFFRENPLPFYTLARELYPGKYRPTITHSFFKLLHDKGLLLKLFTQNIDCLEREAGVPDSAIIEAHGSFAHQKCIDCAASYPDEAMKSHVEQGTIPRCAKCNGLVKPDIVFFGEALPPAFHANRELPAQADLCIVLGTSLTVQPFASLPSFCSDSTPRVLINKERVGGLGSRPDDVLLLGDCDAGVRKLAAACGWAEELEARWEATAPKAMAELGREVEKTKDEALLDEVEKLTKEVDDTLNVSRAHEERVRRAHGAEDAKKEKDATTVSRPKTDGKGKEADAGAESLEHVFPHLKLSAL